LTAYVYFGPILGILFVIALAFIMACVNNIRLSISGTNPVQTALYVTLWMGALQILLHPAIGISNIILISILFFILNSVFKIIFYPKLPVTA
jgi:hypothetical protein